MIEVQQLQLGDQTFGKRKSSLLRRSESAESIGLRRVSTQDVFAGFSDFPYFDVMFKTPSRYISDFLQRQKLGKGTFGSVYTAKHRIDGQEYAVKKIKIGFSNTKELEVTYNKVIREVKSLAALDHPNIVRYHQAWFEPWREEEKSAAEQHYSLEEPSEEFDDEESHSTEGSAPQQGAVKRSLLSEQLNKLNVDDAQDDILFEMDQSLPGRNPSVEFSFDQSPGIGGVQIYENAESEEDDDEPIRNQRVIPESPMASPNMSYLEMAYKQKFKKPSAVLSPTREEPPAPPSIIVNEEDQELQDVRGFLTEIFNEKNLRFEMVLYIQMQLCAPATLETWLWSETRTQERKVDLHAVFHYFRQVVNAIAYVHKNGLIHRDIKPSNIFITHDDRIRIGDFGLAKYIRENLEESPVPPTPTEPTFGEQPPAANRNQNLNANHTTTLSKRKGSPVASAGEHTSGVGTYIYASPEQLAVASMMKQSMCLV
jgi:serine/threonine protein kinase